MNPALLFIFTSLTLFANAQSTDELKMNQIQVIGSHNSYKKLPDPKVMRFLERQRKKLGKDLDPRGIDYGHLPIDSQFNDYQVRGLEIDIYNDPNGDLYYKRRINSFVKGMHQRSGVEALRKPGLKVLHIKDVDYQTNYFTFIEALTAVKKWSETHPSHLPIFINIETKNFGPGDAKGILRAVGFKRTLPFDSVACDLIDTEIKQVFGNDLKGVLTPDQLRGKYNTLEEMALHNGWPTLDESRGKVIFIMLGAAKKTYQANYPNLQGRAMCIYTRVGNPNAAFIMEDDPIRDSVSIPQLVKQGYIVRTRSDEETVDCRSNDCTRRQSAMNSGAQIISTDYYKPDLRFSNFEVRWPDNHPGRVNPILFPGKTVWLSEP